MISRNNKEDYAEEAVQNIFELVDKASRDKRLIARKQTLD